MPSTTEIVEPGRYDYHLTVEFPSTYIPEHTPPAFRNAATQKAARIRSTKGQFQLAAPVANVLIREHLVNQLCEDVDRDTVTVTRFDLTPA
jgi:hypothetical protein